MAGLQPQIVLAILIFQGVCSDFGVPCVVTSLNDGKHSDKSHHYRGTAFDGRCKFPELNGREQAFRDEIKLRLGDDFDVVLEAVGTENEHVHVEYDPK